jgi:hypothetical protein
MQIVERSMLGVRAARQVMQSPDKLVSVTLFPMIHIGQESFYRQVYADTAQHDIVLVEGVRSPITKLITSSYRWIDKAKLNLVVQPRHPEGVSGHPKIVHADLSTDEFHREWAKLPLWLKLLVGIIAPLIGIHRRLFATRESLAKAMEREDLLSSDEILDFNPRSAALRRTILDVRDQRLIERLGEELDRSAEQPRKIAVVYGAGHMRAVLAELGRRNFRTAGATWQMVMSF